MIPLEAIDEFLAESWKAPARARNLVRLLSGELREQVAPTPHEVVARWGRVRLLRYGAPAAAGPVSPILLVPSIINRYYVLDLRPGASLVEHLVGAGVPVYLIDWGTPGPQDRFADMAQHILGWLHAAVRRSCRDAGVEQVHLLGYCIGGTLATAYAALRPRRVAGLVALTAPVDFHDDGILSTWARSPDFPVRRLVESMGSMDRDFLQASFGMIQPLAQPRKWLGVYQNLWDDAFLEAFLPMETWVKDNVDVPGAAYVELIEDLYRANGLTRGSFTLRGEAVDLGDIVAPVLVAISEKDHIVPDPSARVLVEHVSSPDAQVLAFSGGHIGVVVGRAARRELWPALTRWLEERPVHRAGVPSTRAAAA